MHDVVVLAGGRGSRLGGAHKPALELAGASLLDRVLAVCGGDRVVVVGPPAPTSRQVLFVTEQEQYGGPAAALRDGLAHVVADTVVVLAADLYALDAATVAALAAQAPAVLVDDDGREQWLCSAWGTAALLEALRDVEPGDALGARLRALQPTSVRRDGAPWRDVDTPEDWEAACRTTT